MKTITTNTKYVVETHCSNGNAFLRGPFRSKTAAEKYCREKYDAAKWGSTTTYAVRAILHPKKWTKAVE